MLPAYISFSVALTCMLPQEVLKRKLYFVFKLMSKLFPGFFFVCLFFPPWDYVLDYPLTIQLPMM